jgi:hypothetical protein
MIDKILTLCLLVISFPFVQLIGNDEVRIKSGDTNDDKVLTVSYCDLVDKPELYDGKIIRVQASYFTNYEGDFLYDLNCNEFNKYTNPVFSCSNENDCDKLRKAIEKSKSCNVIICRANLVITGRFKGPGSYGKLFPQEPGFRYEIKISKIEKGIPITADTPWPWEQKKK